MKGHRATIPKSIHLISWSLYWFFLVTSFCLIGFLLVAQAIGYRYNPSIKQWQKTGMLIASADPRKSLLTLSNKVYPIEHQTRIANILPGTYHLRLKAPNYHTWEETVTIRPGYVTNIETLTLYLEKPEEIPVTTEHELALINATPDNNVVIRDGELWYSTRFVSRFTQSPLNAILLPSRTHILYVQDQELHLIGLDGQNDQLIFTRQQNSSTPLALVGDRTIVFKDGQTKALRIR